MTKDIFDRVIETAVKIQQVPAPTLEEDQRARFIETLFRSEGLMEVSVDDTGNVYGRIPGQNRAAPLVVTAHLDTVFPHSTNLSVERAANRIAGPGIGDNSIGLAGLFGLLWLLRSREIQPPGDIWLVGTVGEEGLGNLKGMRCVVERFGAAPAGYIILEGMGLGQIFHRGLGVRRYKVICKTNGGHSWIDYGSPSAINHLAALITRLTALPLPSTPRTTLNVGVIQGGTSVNTIAAEASLELDLRSESLGRLSWLVKQVEGVIEASRVPGVKVLAEVIGDRPAGEIPENHPIVRLAQNCLQALEVEPHLAIGSTDANIPLSCGYPAVCIGLTRGGRAHTTEEFIHTSPLAKGLEQLYLLTTHIWNI